MPFKSKAQRRKFAELLMKGEISPETYEEWNRETGSAKLPERVTCTALRHGAVRCVVGCRGSKTLVVASCSFMHTGAGDEYPSIHPAGRALV